MVADQPVRRLILAIIILMIGYVNADSKRRGMNSLLWTLLVIFVPKALGFIAYFLLRKPLMMPCPKCGTPVGSDFRFCPKCGYAVTPMCVIAAAASSGIMWCARIAARRWERLRQAPVASSATCGRTLEGEPGFRPGFFPMRTKRL